MGRENEGDGFVHYIALTRGETKDAERPDFCQPDLTACVLCTRLLPAASFSLLKMSYRCSAFFCL